MFWTQVLNVIKYQHTYNDTWIVQHKMFFIITIMKQENKLKTLLKPHHLTF
jgi:hypothetical protein